MQPYFLPYIGYFQLMQAVDTFVVYDNIKYTKKGWINRNRFLREGKDAIFSLPLKAASDYLDIREREISPEFNRTRLLNQLNEAYRRAPYYAQTIPLIERIVRHHDGNLFSYVFHSIKEVCEHLDISTEIRMSSEIQIDHSLKAQEKVLAICDSLGTRTYINSAGGTELYSKEVFSENGIDLQFIQSQPFEYPQFGNNFVPWLSIVDVLMFNSIGAIRSSILPNYEFS